MQNFTFGRKGLNWFLFAFVLFVGSSYSYGQCADVNDDDAGTAGNQQSYCYLSTVQDLLEQGTDDGDPNTAPANIEIYETADSANDTDPIDRDELLTNATTYFFGDSTDSSCARVPVEVSVDAGPTPQNEITGGRDSFTISPCESSGFTAQELEDLFTNDPGYELEVYDTEFGETALAPGATLTPGDSYFVGQVDDGSGSNCPSTRAAVGYDPLQAPGPTADANQTYCEEATVADLMASGTEPNTQAIRWYRSQTSNSPLADDVQLVNGEDYFAAQVVNDRNSPFPPCETPTGERTRVVVTIIEGPDAGPDNVGIVCEPDVDATFPNEDAIRNFYFALLESNVPTDGTFNPTIDELITQYSNDSDGLGDFTTSYTIGSGSCQDSVDLTIRIIEETPANAGSFDNIEDVCVDDDNIDLTTLTNNDPDATTGGDFSGTGVTNNQFDPSVGAGTYTITYSVDETSAQCTTGSDETTFTITVDEADAGENGSITLTPNDDPVNLFDSLNGTPDMGGTWSPGDGIFDPSTDTPGDFTYTVSNNCGTDSAIVTVIVNECDTPPNAGEDNVGIVCLPEVDVTLSNSREVREYYLDLLDDGVDRTGTFSPTIDEIIDIYADDEDGLGDFTVTYTIGEEGCEDSVDLTIRVVEEAPANAGSFDNIGDVCSDEDPIDLTSLTNNDPDATSGGTFSGEGVTNNEFDPSIGEGTYTITYSVDDTTPCTTGSDNTTFTITVDDSPVSTNINRTLCVTDARDLISNPAAAFAFLQNLVEEAGVETFDADNFSDGAFAEATRLSNFIDSPTSDSETFNFEYTDPSDSVCDNGTISIAITINDQQDAEAGDIEDQTVCSSDGMVDLTNFFTDETVPGGTFSGTGVEDGMFDASIGSNENGYEITYTVDDSADCVTEGTSDSTTFTINVLNGGDAGEDNVGIVCLPEVDVTLSNSREVREYYLDLLDDGVDRTGTFSPTIDEIIDIYADDEDGLGDFTVTYTIGEEGCEDSVDLTIRVVEEAPANAGSFDNIEDVCSDEDPIDLTSLTNNDPDATSGGTFSGEGVTNNEFDPSIGEGTYTITYSVDDTTPCTTGSDDTSFTISVIEAPVSANINRTLCVTDARDLISDPAAGFAFLQNLVEEAGVETFDADNFSDGAFAEATRLSTFIDSPTSDSETFNFEYTDPSDSICGDGVISIAITINELRDAEAGDLEDQTVCESSGMIDLTVFFTDETVPGGTFSGTGVEDGMFNASIGSNENGYEITYTVDDSADCVTEGTSDSTTFIIFVDSSVEAGAPNSADVCRAEVDEIFPNNTAVRNFYLDLLEEEVATDGTFNPSIQELVNAYADNEDQNEFTTTYTVTNGTCSDSVDLTINIFNSIPAEIGDIANPDPICRNAEDIDLFSFLPEDANPNGTFEGYEDGIFSPGMAGVGSFEVTYTLTEDSPCTEGEASATFTITVTEAAFAGMDMDLTVCMNDDVQNLSDFLSVDADDDGEFTLDGEVIADGMMNPADFEAGEYEVVYTVAAINDCGDDTAEFTITVQEAPDAPTVEGDPFTFCATDDATAADLSATGTNLTYYSDEALSMMVAPEDVLVDGTYYVTQRNDDGACESAATEFTVTINDAATPTISNTTQEFCEFDDATIADLTELINETGTITWYDSADGDNALDSGTSLQDGVTYYATLFNVDTGCESSVRLGVTVSINDDCPLTIPEGFSPNGDGLNDRFEIENIRDKYPNFTIEIRNRFGDVVYKGNTNTPDWDGFSTEGSFGSDVLPVGAYFYYLRYNDGSTEPVRGTVYLSR